MSYGWPCVLFAVDDTPQPVPPDGKWPRRDMPRARYAGSFDPAQIPGTTSAVRERSDIIITVRLRGPRRRFPSRRRTHLHRHRRRESVRGRGTGPAGLQHRPALIRHEWTLFSLRQRRRGRASPAPHRTPGAGSCCAASVGRAGGGAVQPGKVPYVKSREDMRRYAATKAAKNLAISTSGTSWWMPTQRQALEACEFSARHPCILYAIQDRVVAPDGLASRARRLGRGRDASIRPSCRSSPRPRARRFRSMPLAEPEGPGRIAAR